LIQIDVFLVETECFAQAQSSDGDQPEERRTGPSAQPVRRSKARGLRHDLDDLIICIDVGPCPAWLSRDQPRRGNLGALIKALQSAIIAKQRTILSRADHVLLFAEPYWFFQRRKRSTVIWSALSVSANLVKRRKTRSEKERSKPRLRPGRDVLSEAYG